jgi:hypothetical protein
MDLAIFARVLRRFRPDHRQTVGTWKWEGAQQDGIDDAEDGAVRADPESEGDDRDNGEAG